MYRKTEVDHDLLEYQQTSSKFVGNLICSKAEPLAGKWCCDDCILHHNNGSIEPTLDDDAVMFTSQFLLHLD